MYDAAILFADVAERESDVLGRLHLAPGTFALATVHRAENTDDPARLDVIVASLKAFSQELRVIFPIHPRTQKALQRAMPPGVTAIDPVSYFDMVELEKNAALVVTDSGGVQKEAFFHQVPCVTLRAETEWPELVELGWNRLAPPTDLSSVLVALRAALGSRGLPSRPYGAGNASVKIAEVLSECASSF
jgi:UDP-GlcNAc3NAcA epimerase